MNLEDFLATAPHLRGHRQTSRTASGSLRLLVKEILVGPGEDRDPPLASPPAQVTHPGQSPPAETSDADAEGDHPRIIALALEESVSPVLSNIYLHKLDEFVERELIPQYTRGEHRAPNPEYQEVKNRLRSARRHGDRAAARDLRRQLRAFPAGDPMDPGYRRLFYCRYADDHLLGFAGPKAE